MPIYESYGKPRTLTEGLSDVVESVPGSLENPVPHVERNRTLPAKNLVARKVDGFVRRFSKIPLAGNLAITPNMIDATRERDAHVKQVRLLNALGVLGLFIFFHGVQANLGINAVEHLAEYQSFTGNPLVDLRAVIDSLYVLINAGAVVSQARMVTRLAGQLGRNTQKVAGETVSWSTTFTRRRGAEKLLDSIGKKDTDSLTTFLLINPKGRRSQIIETAEQLPQAESMQLSLIKLKDISEDYTPGRVLQQTFVKGFTRPRGAKSPYSNRESVIIAAASLGGQLAFAFSAYAF